MKPKKKLDCDFVVKAVIIGDSGVGKTNILLRYCDNSFKPTYSSTIGVDFKLKTIQVEEYKIKLQIWDTAGQEKFKNLSTTFYKGALIIILTYAIDSSASFSNVESWLKQIHEHSSSEASIFLVGNKSDLKEHRQVSYEQGKKLAETYGMPFYEVSAKDGTNIEDLFEVIGKDAYEKIRKLGDKPVNNNVQLSNEDTSTGQGRSCSC